MSKSKKVKEEPVQEQPQEKVPLGFTARADKPALVTFQQFFDLMRILDGMNNIINFVKQENVNADNIRYYFEEDLVETTNEKGEKTKALREDFWN
jgi:hypothetical protein